MLLVYFVSKKERNKADEWKRINQSNFLSFHAKKYQMIRMCGDAQNDCSISVSVLIEGSFAETLPFELASFKSSSFLLMFNFF